MNFDEAIEISRKAALSVGAVTIEGMKLVGPGGKIKLYIPAELAYGRRGAGQLIGPNEALEFKVELHDVIVAEPVVEEPAEEVTEE